MNSGISFSGLESGLFYSLIIVISVGFSYLSHNRHRILFLLSCATIILPLGFRAYTVGTDTSEYAIYFANSYSFMEPGWTILNKLCHPMGFTAFLIIVGTITCGLVFARLWELRFDISLPFSVFIYDTLIYFYSYNGMRQALAVSILFWATRYIFCGKSIYFFLFVMVAASFHKSSFLGVLIWFFCMAVMRNRLQKNQRTMFSLVLLFGPVLIVLLLGISLRMYGQGSYLNKDGGANVGILLAAFFQLVLLVWVTWDHWEQIKINEVAASSIVLSAFSLVCSTVGYFTYNMDRVSFFYQIFIIIAWPYIANLPSKDHVAIRVSIILFQLAYLGYMFYSGRFGVMPYAFIGGHALVIG